MIRTLAIRQLPVAAFWLAALFLAASGWTITGWPSIAGATEFVGTVVDDSTGAHIPCRVYLRHQKGLRDQQGEWLFVESSSPEGSALAYREQWVPMDRASEKHTTISAAPFRANLAPGKYVLTVERGKEYRTLSEPITIGDLPVHKTFRLKRWIDMSRRGWYSGETHVHRRIEELPNVMLAEDLNIAFPVTFWTVNAFEKPGVEPSPLRRQGPSPFGPRVDRGSEAIPVDAHHIILPRNTEYEIFSVSGKRNVLGAVFILNHETIFQTGMPPVAPIAEQAHREGALLDLDKHNWPWSMMLVPIAKIDLYELSNNSIWRTNFSFRKSGVKPAPYMHVETDSQGMTEKGWIEFGLQNYYTLLNCGFRLQPTAGTASGVHPVPLGYSRVYVHTGESFSAERWIDGLRRGRSFVTTGPMLFATIDDRLPGQVFRQEGSKPREFRLRIESQSERPIDRVEIIKNGRIVETIRPGSIGDGATSADVLGGSVPGGRVPGGSVPGGSLSKSKDGAAVLKTEVTLRIDEPSWIAVRSFQAGEDGRVRFAHTAPWHVEFAGQRMRPRREEVEYLVERVGSELQKNRDVLPAPAVLEFRKALAIYEGMLERSRKTFHPTDCAGTYPHHLQGICADEGESIYWSFTTKLVKTDAEGRILKSVPVANHHGDLCLHEGQLHVAVNLGKFNNPQGKADSWVYVYDSSTLNLVRKHPVPEVFFGAGGVGVRDEHFFVVGGLPDTFEENYVYEYDSEYRFQKRHVIASGHTHLGIQTATFASGAWWFGCYGTPKMLIETDADFRFLGKYEFECSLGVEGIDEGRLLVASGSCAGGKGCRGSVRIAVPDRTAGLRLIKHSP